MTDGHESPLMDLLVDAGATVHEYHGLPVARHFSEPQREYDAATASVAVFDRSHRARLRVAGRAPAQMLNGVLTGSIPRAPAEVDGVMGGRATYHAVLTPKGKMVSDLDALLLGDEDRAGFLLDVPVAGRVGLLEHFGRFLPPRFANVTDVSRERASVSVVGPEGARALSKLALGLRVDPEWLEAAEEGEWRAAGSPADGLVVVRTAEVSPLAWTVHGPTGAVRSLWSAMLAEGATPAGLGVWSTLRVEAGRPVFGTDMDDGTLPPEAGIVDRAIDQTKGCYTGQEVIVRIRDRGHVNRHLHRLELGDVPAPSRGTELLATDGSGKVVGEVRSAVRSPKVGGVLALAYVRRGAERVLLDGREVEVGARL
jgi:tRNA-modifying protein YgfZ